MNNSACVATGEVTIEYTQPPNASNATLVQCDPDVNSLAVFNLRTIDALITNWHGQKSASLSGITVERVRDLLVLSRQSK